MAVPTTPDRARWAGRLRLGVLAIVALLSAHTAVYVAQYGTDARLAQAMSSSGHDLWWAPASILVLAAGLAVLVRTLGGLAHLELRARWMTPSSADRATDARFWPEVGSLLRVLFPLVTLLFVVQENVEHLLAHGHLVGLGAIGGPEYPLALPILVAVSLAASFLGALVRWRVAVLRGRTAPLPEPERPAVVATAAHGRWRTIGAIAPRRWMADRLDAGRAPPPVLLP